jgi:hypothetical protein
MRSLGWPYRKLSKDTEQKILSNLKKDRIPSTILILPWNCDIIKKQKQMVVEK